MARGITRLQKRIGNVEGELKLTIYTSQLMRILLLDLLDLAQMENSTFKINLVDMDLFDVCTQAFAIVQHFASLKHITFENQIEEQDRHYFKRLLGDERRYL